MKIEKLLNGLIWMVNIGLGAGVVVFAFQYLIDDSSRVSFIEDVAFFKEDDIPRADAGNVQLNVSALRNLSNPIIPSVPGGDGGAARPVVQIRGVELVGIIPAEKRDGIMAILEITSRRSQVVARFMEPVLEDEEKSVPELQGWMLSDVSQDEEKQVALFVAGSQRAELQLRNEPLVAEAGGPGARGILPGAGGPVVGGGAYNPNSYTSKKRADSNENREIWDMDPQEVEFVQQNHQQLMSQIKFSANGGGGVKIDNMPSGTIGAERGFRTGDVVRRVNGQAINNVNDVKSLGSRMGRGAMTIVVERAGRNMTIQYRIPQRR